MSDTLRVAFGPQQMPPQGARALVGALLGGRRRGPEVSATLDESEPGEAVLEFVNEGRGTAVGLRYIARDSAGTLSQEPVGNLAPGATSRSRLRFEPPQPFCCVWLCQDERGRGRLWSYDGRRKRFPSEQDAAPDATFRVMYP